MNKGITEFIRLRIQQGADRETVIRETMKKFNHPRKKAQIAYYKTNQRAKPDRPTMIGAGITEDELRERHDVKFIMARKLSELNKVMFLTEAEFVKSCGLRSLTGYRSFLDLNVNNKYRGRVSGIVYYSHPESIEKLKMEGTLQ